MFIEHENDGLIWECGACGEVLDAPTDRRTRRAVSLHLNACGPYQEAKRRESEIEEQQQEAQKQCDFCYQLTSDGHFSEAQARALYYALQTL